MSPLNGGKYREGKDVVVTGETVGVAIVVTVQDATMLVGVVTTRGVEGKITVELPGSSNETALGVVVGEEGLVVASLSVSSIRLIANSICSCTSSSSLNFSFQLTIRYST